LEWVLLGRGSGHPGSIIFRVENRSKIGSGIAAGLLDFSAYIDAFYLWMSGLRLRLTF
jgi:hypothetical protein